MKKRNLVFLFLLGFCFIGSLADLTEGLESNSSESQNKTKTNSSFLMIFIKIIV